MNATSRFLATTVMTAVALTDMPASTGPHVVVGVVIHDAADVPASVLGRAIQYVVDLYRPLGVGIAWTESEALDDVSTIHLSILPRTPRKGDAEGVLGIDAPTRAGARQHVAHILYQRVGDAELTSAALAYVMAHLIGRTLRSSGGSEHSTIVRADRHAARRMAGGRSVFGPGELSAIQGGIAALAKTGQ